MYSRVPFSWGEGTSRWRGVEFHEGFSKIHEGHLNLRSYPKVGIATYSVVGFREASGTRTNFLGANHKHEASGRL